MNEEKNQLTQVDLDAIVGGSIYDTIVETSEEVINRIQEIRNIVFPSGSVTPGPYWPVNTTP